MNENQAHIPEKTSPYINLERADWKKLNGQISYPISQEDLSSLNALNEPLTLEEIQDIYFPLSHLLNLHVAQARALHQGVGAFLKDPSRKLPYIIGIAGSVAAGKSTTARVLQKVLSMGPDKPQVDLVTTDGFLYPNRVLENRGILNRKGYPESYDTRSLMEFLAAIKSGKEVVEAPQYSHLIYDVLPKQVQVIRRPDILILEGINVLQVNTRRSYRGPKIFVSDYFDFSIYVHAQEKHLEDWYVNRFLSLQNIAFNQPDSYFRKYADLSETEARATASRIWNEINRPNLIENILPTRFRANLILEKGKYHRTRKISIRKL